MIDIESLFRYRQMNVPKLLNYGFHNIDNIYQKEILIRNDEFILKISIQENNQIEYEVIEKETKEPYALLNVKSAQGQFVCDMRKECEKILKEISLMCFDEEIYKSKQAQRIYQYIQEEYKIKPEFLWESSPDYSVFRREENNKWFSVIMVIDKSKIEEGKSGSVDIMNLKASQECVSELLEKKGYYKAYHMNKKYWYTICLDGMLDDEILYQHIRVSFESVKGK